MNGRMAKQLRRVAANPQLKEETGYQAIQHKRTMYREYFNPETGAVEYHPEGVIRIQVVMDSCRRKMYKTWKARYKYFTSRSNTLPHRGLTQRLGG